MNNEPALIMGAFEAILVLAIAFGVPITPDEKASLIGAISAILSLVFAVVVRQNVTPVAKLSATERKRLDIKN